MPGLTLRDLPVDLLRRLRLLARRERRSLNQEVLTLIEEAAARQEGRVQEDPGPLDVAVQRRLLDGLAGTWAGRTEARRIVREIYATRSAGREVRLP